MVSGTVQLQWTVYLPTIIEDCYKLSVSEMVIEKGERKKRTKNRLNQLPLLLIVK